MFRHKFSRNPFFHSVTGQAILHSAGDAEAGLFRLCGRVPTRDSVCDQGGHQAGGDRGCSDQRVSPSHQRRRQPGGPAQGFGHRGVDSPAQERCHHVAETGAASQGQWIMVKYSCNNDSWNFILKSTLKSDAE